MELWPDTVWRLAAMLRAGLAPARAFQLLAEENAEDEKTSGESQAKSLFTGKENPLRAKNRALELAQEDIQTLLTTCAETAAKGLPLAEAMQAATLKRNYSNQRVEELRACWNIGERTGAPLASVLERLARYLEQEIDLSQARDSAMSGPKSTGTILSWLPLLGLGLGILMGTNPVGTLLGSIPGAVAGVLGVFLALAGRRWTARLVQRAERGIEPS